MTTLLVSLLGSLAFFGTWVKGARWAFCWVYLPTLVMVPSVLNVTITGLPDLTPRRAACLGLILGALVAGRTRTLRPRWHWFDALALLLILSFSISYGVHTNIVEKGVYHKLAALALDWGCPYLLARALLTDMGSVRTALRPLAICTVVSAGLAVYECRMATRLAANLWEMCGFDVPVRTHYTSWRWGYLRAAGIWEAGLPMGTFFATVTPLMALWGLLSRSRDSWKAWVAVLSSAAGCVAGLSRGPILVLGAIAVIFSIVAVRRKAALLALLAIMLAAAPFLAGILQEEVRLTQEQMDLYGNTSSGHYRIALLLIYGRSISKVGFWGDPTIVGADYARAWSIDNAYVFFFLVGGWIGGGGFCLAVVALFCLGARRIARSVGQERKILCAILASFTGVTGCMTNLWFAPSYAPLFWITAGLLLNAVRAHGMDYSAAHRRYRLHKGEICPQPQRQVAPTERANRRDSRRQRPFSLGSSRSFG